MRDNRSGVDGLQSERLPLLTPGSFTELPMLLENKLRIPHHPPNLVSRTRLVEKLDSCLHRPLTLLSAPAGFGKTTLLAEWAGQNMCPSTWVSLTSSDNDPVQFWAYIIAAFQKLNEDLRECLLYLLRPLDIVGMELFLINLLNQIGELREDAVLILDDYHVIESTLIHHGIQFLIENLPLHLHVVIASRVIPPISIALMRTRGQLLEITRKDFAFTVSESSEFFQLTNVQNLNSTDIELLCNKTGGWAAGLHLVALTSELQPNISHVVQSLTGSNRYIVDFLTEEVFQHQSPSIQEFLLKTSILERLTAPLCDAVILDNSRPSQKILKELDRTNIFIVPLDDERNWYQYDQLFSEMLKSQLFRRYPDLVSDLYKRAIDWYDQNGLYTEAVQLASVGTNLEFTVNLIEHRYDRMIVRGETSTLLNWLQELPIDLILSSPLLSVAKAWCLVPLGQQDEALRNLQYAEQAIQNLGSKLEDNTVKSIEGEIAAIYAMIATAQYNTSQIIEYSQKSLNLLNSDQAFIKGLMHISLGVALTTVGDLSGARSSLTESLQFQIETENIVIPYLRHYYFGQLARREGKLHEAAEHYQLALMQCTSKTGTELPIANLAHIGLAQLLYEWNRSKEALIHIQTGMKLCKGWWVQEALVSGYHCLARIEQSMGNRKEALSAHLKAFALSEGFFDRVTITHSSIPNLRLWMQEPDFQKAFRWAEAFEKKFDIQHDLDKNLYAAKATADLLLAEGKLDQANRILGPLQKEMEKRNLQRQLLEILVHRAILFYECNEISQALTMLIRALTLAEPEGYFRIFLDEGELMRELLKRVNQQGFMENYIEKLLASFPEKDHEVLQDDILPIEPLTERELEIIRLVYNGESTKEIASKLVISVVTIRNHLQNIYGKLGVHSKMQAVKRASDLKLL